MLSALNCVDIIEYSYNFLPLSEIVKCSCVNTIFHSAYIEYFWDNVEEIQFLKQKFVDINGNIIDKMKQNQTKRHFIYKSTSIFYIIRRYLLKKQYCIKYEDHNKIIIYENSSIIYYLKKLDEDYVNITHLCCVLNNDYVKECFINYRKILFRNQIIV
jgi:hypothetical protein